MANAPLLKPFGSPSMFAGFDSNGQLNPINGWQISSEFGAQTYQNVAPAADGAQNDYFRLNNFGLGIDPTVATQKQNWSCGQFQLDIDPNNTGLQFGDNYNGGGTALSAFVSHHSSAHIGYAKVFDGGVQLGNPSEPNGICDHLQGPNVFLSATGPYTIGDVNGFNLGSHFDPNVVIQQGVNGFTLGHGINQPIQYFNAFADFTNFGSGAVMGGGYEGATIQPSFASGSVMKYVTGFNFGAAFQVGAGWDPTGGMQCFQASPVSNGQVVTQQYCQGFHADFSNWLTTSRKVGVDLNDAVIQVNANYTPQNNSGVDGANSFNTQMLIASGSPVSNVDSLVNNFSVLIEALDNIPIGPIGLGVSFVGAVGQVAVAAGKTIDVLNGFVAGFAVAPLAGDGGTIARYNCYDGLGALPEGGNSQITELVAFHGGPYLSALAASSWGFLIDDPNAENYVMRMVVGGSTKKVTNASVGFEVADNTKAILHSRMTTVQRDALTAVAGMQIFNTDTNTLQFYNGTSWI